MSKYFDTKPGSLEEAVSAAQQAAIAISKKEKGEKPKNEKDEDASQFAFVAKKAKEDGEKTFMFAGKKYDTETEEVIKEAKVVLDLENDDPKLIKDIKKFGLKVKDLGDSGNAGYNEFEISGPQSKIDAAIKKLQLEGYTGGATGGMMGNYKKGAEKKDKENMKKEEDKLDPVNPKAVKKKFADRKDKDIDNDGDVDDSDKFLHKRRKAVSKAMGEEITEEEFEMMIETLTELSPALLKRARDAAKAKQAKMTKRADAVADKGGDASKYDSAADKARGQASKFDRAADKAGEKRSAAAMDKLKAKGQDDKATDAYFGNVKSKDAEKQRRKDAVADKEKQRDKRFAPKQKGFVSPEKALDTKKKGYDAYVAKTKAKGQKPMDRDRYDRQFGKKAVGKLAANYEHFTGESHRSLKDAIVNMWKEAQDMEQDKNGDGLDDDQKPKKTMKKTDSGKPMTPVETSPKMPKTKNEKNSV